MRFRRSPAVKLQSTNESGPAPLHPVVRPVFNCRCPSPSTFLHYLFSPREWEPAVINSLWKRVKWEKPLSLLILHAEAGWGFINTTVPKPDMWYCCSYPGQMEGKKNTLFAQCLQCKTRPTWCSHDLWWSMGSGQPCHTLREHIG